jgi:ABC-2 type transport system ATP-binding protein
MITIQSLGYRYPRSRRPALQNINLEIEPGTLFGLIGPNGAGKTTLIALLTGLLEHRHGRITVMGHSFARRRKTIQKMTGYIPQEYAFYPGLTVLENLRFFAGVQGVPRQTRKQRIDYCLETCRLQRVGARYAGQLSGGLKRRLNIAIGLLTDPDIVYLDEPTAGIDPQSRAFILDRIRQLNRDGKTIIYTSHYMEEVEKLCDRLAVIDHGEVLAEGTLAELQRQTPDQTRIECHRPLSEGELERIRARFPVTASGTDLSVQALQKSGDLAGLLSLLDTMDIGIDRLNHRHGDLESLFLRLTDRALRDG